MKLLVLIVDPIGETVSRVARGVDTQSLPYDAFDVCYVLEAPEKHLRDRLDSLRAHRPNVKVLAGERGKFAELAREALQGAEAGYVLVVPGEAELYPEAFARLRELAGRYGPAVVEGRASGVGPSIMFVEAGAANDAIGAIGGSPAAADWLRQWEERVCSVASKVVALEDYPVSRGDSGIDGRLMLHEASVAWDGPLLVLSCRLPQELRADQASFFLRSLSTGLEFSLPTQILGNETGLREGRVDLAVSAAGDPLPGGEWEVGVETRGARAVVRMLLPNVPLSSAIVRGRPVVRTMRGPHCRLQVDHIRRNLIHADPAEARIAELVRGTRLELPLHDLHVAETEALDGQLVLGGLRIGARIRVVDGLATLETWLTGLAGS